jgi:RNA polymerase sigma factor (sigma-70 family)
MNTEMANLSLTDPAPNVQVIAETRTHFATSDLVSESRSHADDLQLAVLIEQMVAQNEGALSKLYEATLPRVFGLVLRIVRNRSLAEEVVEETYFQAWRQSVRYDPTRGRAITWLLNIARSRAIDALRKEDKFEHFDLETEGVDSSVDESSLVYDELIDVAKNSHRVKEALLTLGAQPRQLVALAFFKGFSHEEISEHMTLPLGTVKTQIRRALASLKVLLNDLGPEALESQKLSR